MKTHNRLSSLNRGLEILLALGQKSDGMRAAELSEALQLPLSTLYRYMNVLMDHGMVTADPGTNRYFLGNRLLSLADRVPVQRALVQHVLPFLAELSQKFQETMILVQVSGMEAMCLERVESRTVVRLSFEKGAVLPLHAGASARILMAHLPEQRVDEVIAHVGLERYTDNTITDPDELKRVLAKVREQGYAISDEEYDRGVRAIAVPLFDGEGAAIAGLSCVGPMFRLDETKTKQILEALLATSERVRRQWERSRQKSDRDGPGIEVY